ncbi:hypothetical protein M406DRAFT_341643 [Cryphonectria parasitica EP155]|uniref:CAP-Gly domain-containing protein n=1 Tax=Cryphonectria parasitica (strain ATCC 38755 / EP155) TaxID=660469 RepID=A0A9P4XW61_CRYP1|nr:uncharacterized protein M406DRAFT_341643 [Cryphonectria parasitica EP155]KAF3762412.1 hypothetical protein M406DRAFT_341643 [Cryphonectria parasitica EP155]
MSSSQVAAPPIQNNNTTTTTITTPTTPTTPRSLRRPNTRKLPGPGRILTASTPNLRSAYVDSSSTSTPPVPLLQRKGSQAALTSNSLATIPDASEIYALATLNGSSSPNNKMAPSPLTPRAGAAFGGDVTVGDTVDVPGDMQGMVRFVGTIPGKKGVFAGVELRPDFAPRGKNNGDVDGVSYFTTSIPGAGIFLPLNKAVKREPPPNSSYFPMSSVPANGLKAGTQNSTNYTPPTASVAQFSKSVGPGRASSPLGKKSRPSLSGTESPTRKLQVNPGARPSLGTPAKNMPRYGSPTQNKFSHSARGPPTPGDPAKRGMLQPNRNFSTGPRSTSALSAQSTGLSIDEEHVPVGNGITGPREPGRPSSGQTQHGLSRQAAPQDEEIERLRAEVADRDRQLKEQAATLVEMESSLTEVQSLMEQVELPAPARKDSLDDKDTAHLRALIKEKNEKIAMLTAEFDTHRADFRSTIDTLELASSETERVYEKRIEELMQDIQHISERESDVDAVATQLKQLEELVQELEEGLEDARRGEAEARGEVEFLRGEEDQPALFKELEQKEDEIRGLKAIIHSLSRDSVPGDVERPSTGTDDTAAREKLEREVAELRALLDTKNNHEEEMEHELEALRRGSMATLRGNDRSSVRDSRDTVVLAQDSDIRPSEPQAQRKAHNRVRTLDTMPSSDGLSSITEHSTLWCELCETSGHDILGCTNMFGNQGGKDEPALGDGGGLAPPTDTDHYKIAPLSPRLPLPPVPQPASNIPEKIKGPPPSMMDPGPVAGKESGIIDPDAWCALCEKDGHNSVDCPFEDAF